MEWHQIRESNVDILASQLMNAWGKDAALNIISMPKRFPGVLSLYQSKAISRSELTRKRFQWVEVENMSQNEGTENALLNNIFFSWHSYFMYNFYEKNAHMLFVFYEIIQLFGGVLLLISAVGRLGHQHQIKKSTQWLLSYS